MTTQPLKVVLVVPPCASLDRPNLGIHVLQACARAAGHDVRVLYANIRFAARVGERQYENFTRMPMPWLIGERLFAREAYGIPPLGHDRASHILPELHTYLKRGTMIGADGSDAPDEARLAELHDILTKLADQAAPWRDEVVQDLLAFEPDVVGCGSTFEQTAASIALLTAVKQARPSVTTLMGGANCEGEMAEGIASVAPSVDHIFSGESEASFVDFLAQISAGEQPSRIVEGEPCRDLDSIPQQEFSEYYHQLEAWLPNSQALQSGLVYLPYETSRGCWWGEKRHCTFCGLNGEGMGFRKKSPDRAISEIGNLMEAHPTPRVVFADNIMPHDYFRTFLPRVADELPGLELFYEQKSNLTFEKVRLLSEAGVVEVQPGIESLSTGLLRLMNKGVTASQNLAALRYARIFGIAMHWNLLVRFPLDEIEFYQETNELLPLLRHLYPPTVTPIVVSRFSPYFTQAKRFGITRLEPFQGYRDVLPEGAPAEKVAYHFDSDFPSACYQEENKPFLREMAMEVGRWRAAWSQGEDKRPVLRVDPAGDSFLLRDTRGLPDSLKERQLNRDQARQILVRRPLTAVAESEYSWAFDAGLIVRRDGSYVPLAVAPPDLLHSLEQEVAALKRPPQRDPASEAARPEPLR